MKRQAWVVNKLGNLRNMEIRETDLPEPGEKEVTIQVHSIGLNYADLFAVMGLYKAAPKTAFIPGLEFSGVVVKTGTAVKRFKTGDSIMGVTKFGAYTTHLNIDEHYIDPLPEGWSFQEGAAFPVQVLTAWYALKSLGNVSEGQTVLIHSAAGGVGLLANRIAKKYGCFTIGVIGSSFKAGLLKEEGCDEVLLRDRHFRSGLKKALNGRDLNLVLESSGGKYMKWSYEAMAPMGRMVCFGSAQFTPHGDAPNYLQLAWKYIFRPRFDPLTMITENKSVMAFNLIWLYERTALMRELMKEIHRLELKPPHIGHTFNFKELPEALRLFKSGKTTGKVIVHIPFS